MTKKITINSISKSKIERSNNMITLKKNNIEINYSESLEVLVKQTIILLNKKIKEYKNIFNLDKLGLIKVNYFDNKDDFRNFIYNIRGEKESLPKYATGTYDKGMINAYIKEEQQLIRLYTATHELFHILYMKSILNNDYKKRIVWYDEGMAQFLSGEKDLLKNEEKFKEFYIKVKNQTIKLPNINIIKHGETFMNEMYNGYDLSYLSIKYLSEILSKKEFINLMSDFNKINLIGETILEDMFKYYDNKLKEGIKNE